MANDVFTPLFDSHGFDSHYFSDAAMNQYANLVMQQSQAIWEREDSAHQREVEDLKKAGLNPWLSATGNGLSTSTNVPAMDSLASLISMVSSNLGHSNFDFKVISKANDVVFRGLDYLYQVMDSLGSVFGS